jgi:AmmeMemoRadiSam system protein B
MWHRSPVVAGSFYPSNPRRLSDEIDGYLRDVEDRPLGGELVALVSPHAGYIYSGPVAAYSFKQLMGSGAELAVVIAPSHRARFDGASVIPSGIYETPLGKVSIDESIGERLAGEKPFTFIKEVHQAEHSLEVQVPFLQKVLTDFSIVPIIVGTIDLATCREIAEEIAASLAAEKRKYIIVLSTDLSHYFPYDRAKAIDDVFIQSLLSFDEDDLFRTLSADKAQACGEGPVLAGMIAAKKLGARRVELLKYANSGDTAGSRDQVVGYLAAAMVR